MAEFEYRHDNVEEWPSTPPLETYQALCKEDDNLFWRLDPGDAQNLLEDALARLEKVEATLFGAVGRPWAGVVDECVRVIRRG